MKTKIKDFITNTATNYSISRRFEFPRILKYSNPKKNENILDVACGSGELAIKIASNGSNVYGIDLDKKEIEIANRVSKREKLNCEFTIGNAEDLPYENEYFDKIVSSCALEHFKNDEKALKEMNRTLKSNGSIVLSVDSFSYPVEKNLKEIHRNKYQVVNYYTLNKLEEKLNNTGFKLNKSKYIINSKLTSLFYNYLYIKIINSKGIYWNLKFIPLSIIAYPLCLLSDKVMGHDDKGYVLIVKAIKISNINSD